MTLGRPGRAVKGRRWPRVGAAKRNGTIVYEKRNVEGSWSFVTYEGWPIGFSAYVEKSVSCVRGAHYHVLLFYTTQHAAYYAPYSGYLASGSPKVFC
jgi:hypothetical protein